MSRVEWNGASGAYPEREVLPVMILIRKRALWALALCGCSVLGMASVLWAGLTTQPVFAPAERSPVVWIIDPGHGGEDGGAVSESGVQESGINLAVSLRLREILRFTGQQTRMTREADVSICDEGLPSIRARKASDIRNRVTLVNETPGAVLVSIHQNSLPASPETHGAQAFWNTQTGGEALAGAVQEVLNITINTHRAKNPRQIPQTIYLMNHVTAPAILVECGFLSNPAETALLGSPDYQTKLAAVIAAGCLRAGEETP